MPYFSPSSVGDDPRALYEKCRGAKKDKERNQPNQGRQVRIGTAIGDIIQRDILFAEKHMEGARFSFDRNEYGEPMFEQFAKMARTIEHNGEKFAFMGTCDGIMRYVNEYGEILRVGLEVKSKQTTYAKTSGYSMRNGAEQKHIDQCVTYSLMYDVDLYVILYVNGCRKSWDMSDEDYEKNPDIAAFGIYVSDEMKEDLLDRLADIVRMAREGDAPNTDLARWKFNGFKKTIAAALTDEEVDDLRRKMRTVMRSGLQDYKKRDYEQGFNELTSLRKGSESECSEDISVKL